MGYSDLDTGLVIKSKQSEFESNVFYLFYLSISNHPNTNKLHTVKYTTLPYFTGYSTKAGSTYTDATVAAVITRFPPTIQKEFFYATTDMLDAMSWHFFQQVSTLSKKFTLTIRSGQLGFIPNADGN